MTESMIREIHSRTRNKYKEKKPVERTVGNGLSMRFISRDALQCGSNQLSSSDFQHSQKGLLNLVFFRWAIVETTDQTKAHYLNTKKLM